MAYKQKPVKPNMTRSDSLKTISGYKSPKPTKKEGPFAQLKAALKPKKGK